MKTTELSGRTINNANIELGIKPKPNGTFVLYYCAHHDWKEFNLSKCMFKKAETYIKKLEGESE